jgi:hypothetical protein
MTLAPVPARRQKDDIMKLKSIVSFIVIGAFLAGVGIFFLTDPGARAADAEAQVVSDMPQAGTIADKTPVVTVTDIPLADLSPGAGD